MEKKENEEMDKSTTLFGGKITTQSFQSKYKLINKGEKASRQIVRDIRKKLGYEVVCGFWIMWNLGKKENTFEEEHNSTKQKIENEQMVQSIWELNSHVENFKTCVCKHHQCSIF